MAYALLILHAGVAESERMFHILVLVVISMVLHSSTDVTVVHAFRRRVEA